MGDNFVKEASNTLATLKESAKRNNDRLYLQEYYNITTGYPLTNAGVKLAVTRMVNALTDMINEKHEIPHFVVVLMDRDIISDVDIDGPDAVCMIRILVNWLVKQIDVLIRRKRAELLDKKPGGLYEGHPTLIFV